MLKMGDPKQLGDGTLWTRKVCVVWALSRVLMSTKTNVNGFSESPKFVQCVQRILTACSWIKFKRFESTGNQSHQVKSEKVIIKNHMLN